MELTLSPLTFIFGMFITVSHALYFVSRMLKESRKFYSEQSSDSVIRKRRFLILFMVVTLTSLLAFNSMGMFEGYPLKYRSVAFNDRTTFMVYLECLTTSLIKTMIFFSVSMIVPLIYNNSKTRSRSILTYSIIRLIFYPYLLVTFHNYKYFSLYFTDLLELSESIFLLYLFISIISRISRRKETHDLFVQYETVFIYRKTKSCCLFFIFQTLLEITYYFCLSIYMVRGEDDVAYLMDILMICKVIYIHLGLVGVSNIIFSKEQPIYDTLANMYKIRLEMEEDVPAERKRFKKNDMYRLSL